MCVWLYVQRFGFGVARMKEKDKNKNREGERDNRKIGTKRNNSTAIERATCSIQIEKDTSLAHIVRVWSTGHLLYIKSSLIFCTALMPPCREIISQ